MARRGASSYAIGLVALVPYFVLSRPGVAVLAIRLLHFSAFFVYSVHIFADSFLAAARVIFECNVFYFETYRLSCRASHVGLE